MAAYAATVSLMHMLDLIKNHPSPLISFDKQQLHSLTQQVTFCQEFLEGYVSPFSYNDEVDPLEIRIAEAVHAAEDVIESYIVDNIHFTAAAVAEGEGDDDDGVQLVAAAATYYEEGQIRYINFYECLHQVTEAMDMIKKDVSQMDRENDGVKAELWRNVVSVDAGFRSSSTESKIEMVGFDDVLLQLLDRLAGGNLSRQIIPIVGMGGIGKTTLARNVFEHALIKEHFDICVWATISQDYDIEQTLSEVLSQAKGYSSGKTDKQLGEALYKHLSSRRYLVVLDDIWSIEAWDKMRFFFPDYNNGSRVLVTTRLSNLATNLTDPSSLLDMRFLDEFSSWILFSKTVFGEESSPLELEEIGKKIVGSCKGLPLAIAVVGGLLAKSRHTLEYWEHIEANLSSIVNSENDEYCLRALKMSYNHLPAYLKPCFLYMGLFEEDCVISVSTLTKLWVSEGFLKPTRDKNLEAVAKEYLQELVDRNLVLVHRLGLLGNVKYCKMHDLLRDLALLEAQKQRFYYASRQNDPRGLIGQRRIVMNKSTSIMEVLEASKFMADARSYVCHEFQVPDLPEFRLLRTLVTRDTFARRVFKYSLEHVFRLVNSRYLDFGSRHLYEVPSSIELLWNLQTLIVSSSISFNAPIEIWNMLQLRHVNFKLGTLYLPDPPQSSSNNDDDGDTVVMKNLQTLVGVADFNLSEEVVKRIPNVKKLHINYGVKVTERVKCLGYLERLSKLENFHCHTGKECEEYLHNITFPHSINNLSLESSSTFFFELNSVLEKIGSLPLLYKLRLAHGYFGALEWETVEGQFQRLRSLELLDCRHLQNWTVSDSSHFPVLEKVVLQKLLDLHEFPSEIGEIATLESISVTHCRDSVVLSIKKMVEELEDLHGEEPSFSVRATVKVRELEISLASPKFQVVYMRY